MKIEVTATNGYEGDFEDSIIGYDIKVYDGKYDSVDDCINYVEIATANIYYIESSDLYTLLDIDDDFAEFMPLLGHQKQLKEGLWEDYYKDDTMYIINRFKFNENYRNQGLGLSVLRQVLRTIGAAFNDCVGIFLMPYPLNKSELDKSQIEQSVKKLKSIYKDWGFKTFMKIRDTEIMGMLPALRNKLID